MLDAGLAETALKLAAGARARYTGRQRNPWNEIECGDHYVRGLSSWRLLEAASGYAYDAPARSLTLAPRLGPDDFRGFFVAAEGWGRFAQQRASAGLRAEVALDWGRLELRQLRLGWPAAGPAAVTARLAGQRLPAGATLADGRLAVEFDQPLVIRAG